MQFSHFPLRFWNLFHSKLKNEYPISNGGLEITLLSLPCLSVLATGFQIPFCINSRIFLSKWSVSVKKIGLELGEQNGKCAFCFLWNVLMHIKELARLEFLESEQQIVVKIKWLNALLMCGIEVEWNAATHLSKLNTVCYKSYCRKLLSRELRPRLNSDDNLQLYLKTTTHCGFFLNVCKTLLCNEIKKGVWDALWWFVFGGKPF